MKKIVLMISITVCFWACYDSNGHDGAEKKSKTADIQNSLTDILAENYQIEEFASGFGFLEGPIWDVRENRLIFSDVSGNKLHQWTSDNGVSVFLEPSNFAGGNTFDAVGNIISCQGGIRSLGIIRKDGKAEVLVSEFDGKKFNSPNEVVVKKDGTIWFTDPDYGLLAAYGEKASEYRELDKYHIFRYNPKSKEIVSVYTDLSKPNGLVFSKDERHLFVGNSMENDRKLIRFDVDESNSLQNMVVLSGIESKTWGIDGLKMDVNENLYAACGDGVNIFHKSGHLIGKINTDFEVTNLCFGGENGKTLFITGHHSLYKVELLIAGVSRI